MRSGVRKKLDDLNLYIESKFRMHVSRKNAKKRLKKMNGGFDIKDDYKNIVIPYWREYGIKPQKFWFDLFCDREKVVEPRYIPDDLWCGVIVPYYSNSQFRRLGEDKCQHDLFFPNLKRPGTIVKNIAGVYYDKDMNVISESKALEICSNIKEEFLIKPSIDSGEGRLIQFFEEKGDNRKLLEKTFSDLKANFIAQYAVKQHPVLSKLNPSSLNTVRVISFFFEGQVYILSSILRIGGENSKVDNLGAGGYGIPILENGVLNAKGVNKQSEWVDSNSKGIKFSSVTIPSYNRIIEQIKETHSKIAHFKLVGWDFGVDIENDPVFIEYNTVPGQNQYTVGPTFGELTEKVLNDVFIEKKLKYSQN